MNHFETIDFLEDALLDESESEASRHAAFCSQCAATRNHALALLASGRAESISAVDARPDHFWTLQQESISRSILLRARASRVYFSFQRIAAIVVVAIGLGTAAGTLFRADQNLLSPVSAHSFALSAEAANQRTGGESVASSDPWKSEELQEFGQVIAWENWQQDAAPGDSL